MSRWLITGGTGSLGQALTRRILDTHAADVVVIYSRDEHKQERMAQTFGDDGLRPDSRLRFKLGDVRNLRQLTLESRGCDVIVHAAALKIVPALEYNPFEAVQTNVLGAQHVIEAAVANQVARVLALSTDKACQPVNLYGATKLVAEKLLQAADAEVGPGRPTRFAVLRYGNVTGSNGSVVPRWRAQLARGERLTITEPNATRFWLTLDAAAALVLDALEAMAGGEVFIPKLPAYTVGDLAAAVLGEDMPRGDVATVGLRPGEKPHEWLIGADEERQAADLGRWYVLRAGRQPRTPVFLGSPILHYASNDPGVRRLDAAALRARLADLGL